MAGIDTTRRKALRVSAYRDAAKRWQERSGQRADQEQALLAGGPMAAESPKRVAEFASRERKRSFFERMIGDTLDFTRVAPNQQARVAGMPVARVVELGGPGFEPQGFGSGFLVSDRLLLTNHHVFPTAADTRGTAANFAYEYDEAGRLTTGTLFETDADTFFYASEELDFALIALKPSSSDGQILTPYGRVRLINAIGKILLGQPINIIQYPEGGPKQFATTNNKLVDVLDKYLHYTTDTLEGSSGSPAFNQHWELVALHHCGVPAMRDGQILTTNGRIWTEDMPESQIRWEANEGVRVSCIVEALKAAQLNNAEQQALLQRLVATTNDPLDERIPASATTAAIVRRSTDDMAQNVFNIQGNVTINQNAAGQVAVTSPQTELAPAQPLVEEKTLRFDQKYGVRKGYQSDFLGEDFAIDPPAVIGDRKEELLTDDKGKRLVLKYHHFSLEMHAQRRLQIWSAVNVDYRAKVKGEGGRASFGKDKWIFDPRLKPEDQIGDDEFYGPATKVDRGHIVRREDNAWGNSDLEREYSNSDTFHFTNCTPQHEAFNRENESGLWGKLEEHIRQNIGDVQNKACIFAGPVLDPDDPAHDFGLGSIQYPLKFWKVFAALTKDGGEEQLMVYGFVLDQTPVVKRLGLESFKLESIDFSQFKRQQVPLATITDMTGVKFADILYKCDVMAESAPVALESLKNVKLARVKSAAGPS